MEGEGEKGGIPPHQRETLFKLKKSARHSQCISAESDEQPSLARGLNTNEFFRVLKTSFLLDSIEKHSVQLKCLKFFIVSFNHEKIGGLKFARYLCNL